MRTNLARPPLLVIIAVCTDNLARRLARTALLGCLLGSIAGFKPSLEAAERYWTGSGAGDKWSNPFSWIPIGVPQDGDDIVIGGVMFLNTPGTMVNDLPDLTVRSITFDFENEFLEEAWVLNGNGLTVTGDIICKAVNIEINVALTLGRSIAVQRDVTFVSDDTYTIRLNGPLNLGEHNLNIVNKRPVASVFRINSTITGHGNLSFINEDTDHVPLVVFGGAEPNTFTGNLTVERTLEPNARPFHASFDKPGGNVVNGELVIGHGCEVTLRRADQIRDDAIVSITGGGRLLLNGHPETLGSLQLTNVHADADPTLVDASGTTLTLRGGITTSVFNEDGNIPTIKGTLALSAGLHDFDLNNQLPRGPGLDMQARIEGQGGFSKSGNAVLVLNAFHTFSGLTEVRAGTLELQGSNPLGFTHQLSITDGDLVLRDVAISNATLRVRGTKTITGNSTGSLVTCIGTGGWVGPVALERDLVVNSTGQCTLGGPIDGAGGLELLGFRHQLVSGPSETDRYTFTGPTRVLCELVTVSADTPFHGPLMIGGGFSPSYEIRWENKVNGTVPEVTLDRNGFADLNGHDATWADTIFNGGRVNTGAGRLSLGGVTVHPANVTSVIEGNLVLLPGPLAHFEVGDGPASPDLSVNATISDSANNLLGIEKTGEGTMDLHRANTFRGFNLVRAGTLSVLNNNALGSSDRGTVIESGATVSFGNQADTVFEPFTIAGPGLDGTRGALVSGGHVWINADIVLTGPAAIRADGTNSRVQVNNISGTGGLTKLGSGRLVLRGNANNSYSGDTLVQEGVLDLAKPSSITSIPGHLIIGTGSILRPARVEHRSSFTIAGSVTVNRGLWDLQGSTESYGIPELQGRPPLTLLNGGSVRTGVGILIIPTGGDVVVTPGVIGGSQISGRIGLEPGNHRFLIGSGNGLFGGGDCTVSAEIRQNSTAAGIEKAGPGTLILSGNNTYFGDTIVSSGRLQVEGSQPQSLVRVEAGSLEGVAGIVGPVVMNASLAAAAPRDERSSLICGNFGGVGALQIRLNGLTSADNDQWDVRGTVDLSQVTLSPSFNFSPVPKDLPFMIIKNDGADPAVPFFGLAQDATLVTSAGRFRISYTAGDGNDVTLTLTDRLDAAANVWMNTLGGNWHNPTNWSQHVVPDFAGTGLIGTPPSAAITNNGIYTITNDLDVMIGEFFYANGFSSLVGNGSLAIKGPFIWDAGSLAGVGTIAVEGPMHVSSAANLTGKLLGSKTLIIKSTATWGGNGLITLHSGAVISNIAGATFDCTGDGTMNNGVASNLFVNAGVFRKTGGIGRTTINVSFQNDGQIEVQSGTLTLNNGGTQTGSISVPGGATFEIAGTHDFRLNSMLTGAGSFTVNGGPTNNFTGTIDLSGDHTFNSGTINITGKYNSVGNTLTIKGGMVNLNGTGTIAPAALNVGGFGGLGGSSSITVNGPMAWSGSSYIGGSGAIVANGGLDMSGNLVLEGKTMVNQTTALWTGTRGGSFTLGHGAALINEASATFDFIGVGAITGSGTTSFINRGLFRKRGDTNEIRLDTFFDNTGAVEIESGGLQFAGGGTSAGHVKVANGATLSLGGDTFHLLAGASFTGEGDFRVSGGTANLAGLVDLRGAHTFSGGIANITGDYRCNGNRLVDITDGTVNFNGTGVIAPVALRVGLFGRLDGSSVIAVSGPMTISPGATLAGANDIIADGGLSMAGNIFLSGRTLINKTRGSWTNSGNGQLTFAAGATLLNAPGATFDLISDGFIVSGAGDNAIINQGLIRKITAIAAATISVPLINSGTVEIQSGTLNLSTFTQNQGVTRLNGGDIGSSSPVQINGGSLEGSGRISASVVNAGVLRPRALRSATALRGFSASLPNESRGELIITGDYTQSAGGTLDIEITGTEPGAGFDRLVVGNKVTLGGTVNVTFANGFSPAPNSSLPFLVTSNRTGAFAAFNYPSNEFGLALNGNGSNLTIQVVNTRPVITPIADQTVTNFSTLRVMVNATDNDSPAQSLTFGLTGAPPGATIDAAGLLTWKPFPSRTPLTTSITVLVTDSGSPNLTASQTFRATVVGADPGPFISLQSGTPGTHSMTLAFIGTPNSQYLTQYATNLPALWFSLATNRSGADGVWSIIDPNATNSTRFYRAFSLDDP